MRRLTLVVLLLILLAGCLPAPTLPLPRRNLDNSCPYGNIDQHAHTQPDTYWNADPYSYAHPRPDEHPVYARQDYPGSDIVVERELERGANYRRYYAWYQSEGLKIYGLLTIPEGEMPEGGWPAIVFNHGYIPPDVYRTTERYIAYVDRIARAGYVVYRIDYRGHDRSKGEATGAYGSPDYTIDVLNAVASIKKHPQVILKRSACGAIPWAAI